MLLAQLADDLARLIAAIPDAKDVVAVEHVTATAPNAYQVHLAGTDHMSVTDLPLFSPALVSLINTSAPQAGGQEVDLYLSKRTGLELEGRTEIDYTIKPGLKTLRSCRILQTKKPAAGD
jgi:hypothetical protein